MREVTRVELIHAKFKLFAKFQYQTFRDENPFGATNPLDISDDDLPF